MDMEKIWASAQAGANWLVSQQQADGGWKLLPKPVVDAFPKAPWALGLTGHPVAAHRCLDYIVSHLLDANGDVNPRKHPWHTQVHYPYANAYLVIGSMRLGRYDVTLPTLRFLLGLQDLSSGAFASVLTEHNTPVRCDTMSTAAAGLACLTAGQLHVACRAADWLGRLVDRQPDPEKQFFCTVDAEDSLVVNFAEEDAPWRVVRADKPDQIWYAVGLPFAFLVKLSQALGSQRYLNRASWFLDFQMRCVSPWAGPSSGKAGWGCAELYRMTGESRYRDIALSIAEYITGFQASDGYFSLVLPDESGPSHRLAPLDFDVTAEYTLWLALIYANVQARDGR